MADTPKTYGPATNSWHAARESVLTHTLPGSAGTIGTIALLGILLALATVANLLPINPLVFRVLFILVAILALLDRGAAATLLLCIPALGVLWSHGQSSIPLAAFIGAGIRLAATARTEVLRRLSALDAAIALFAAAVALSVPMATDARSSFFVAVQMLVLIGMYVFLSRAFTNDRNRRTALACLVGVGVYSALIGIGQAFIPRFPLGFQGADDSGIASVATRATGFFENPNTYGVMLVLCAVVALENAMSAATVRRALSWIGATVVLVVGIEASYTRAAYVGLGVAVLTLLIFRAPRTRRTAMLLIATLAVLVVSAVATQATSRGFSIASVTRDPSSMDRVYLGLASAKMFRDHPLRGMGMGAFEREYPVYSDSRVAVSPVTDPHQSVVSIPAETGALGLLAELGVVAALGWAASRAKALAVNGTASVAGLAAAVAFLAMAALNTQHYLYSFWIALALAGAFMLQWDVAMLGGRIRPFAGDAVS